MTTKSNMWFRTGKQNKKAIENFPGKSLIWTVFRYYYYNSVKLLGLNNDCMLMEENILVLGKYNLRHLVAKSHDVLNIFINGSGPKKAVYTLPIYVHTYTHRRQSKCGKMLTTGQSR